MNDLNCGVMVTGLSNVTTHSVRAQWKCASCLPTRTIWHTTSPTPGFDPMRLLSVPWNEFALRGVAATHHPWHLCSKRSLRFRACMSERTLAQKLRLLTVRQSNCEMYGLPGLPVLYLTRPQHTTLTRWFVRWSGPLLRWQQTRPQAWYPPGMLAVFLRLDSSFGGQFSFSYTTTNYFEGESTFNIFSAGFLLGRARW